MNQRTESTDLLLATKQVDTVVQRIFAALRAGSAAAQQLWTTSADSEGRVQVSDLRVLQGFIEHTLRAHPFFDGAGFVIDPSGLRDAARYQEWWRPTGHGTYEFLDVKTGFGVEPYDYTTMSWFAGAAQGLDSVRGPYMDLSGSDRYVLTFAAPVHHQGRFIGISGADVTLASFEGLVLDQIFALPATVVVVNNADRIVISSSPDHAPGERMRVGSTMSSQVGGPGVNWRVHSFIDR